jgi:hypothetical protein
VIAARFRVFGASPHFLPFSTIGPPAWLWIAHNAWVTGQTRSADFPTGNPLRSFVNGPAYDAFVAKFDPTGAKLLYSKFLGGQADDAAVGIVLDAAGNVYVAVNSISDRLSRRAESARHQRHQADLARHPGFRKLDHAGPVGRVVGDMPLFVQWAGSQPDLNGRIADSFSRSNREELRHPNSICSGKGSILLLIRIALVRKCHANGWCPTFKASLGRR